MKTIHIVLSYLALSAVVPAFADDAKLIDFPAGLSFPLVEKGDQLSARIPVNPGPEAPVLNSLQVQRRDVFSVEGRPESLTEKIFLKWEPGTKDLGSALVVSAKAEDILPGAYTLVVDISPIDTTTVNVRQAATFTLQRLAPQLTSLRSVNVWQERGLFSTANTNGRVNLSEATNKAAVRALSFNELRNPPTVQGPETGNLIVKMTETAIPAGGGVELEVVPEGEFPIGKTTGKLYVRSPQLAAPLTIDYEVTAVRTSIWIAICAAVGAFSGWGVRIFLQARRDRLLALITASEALAALVKARISIPDEDFTTAVETAERVLKEATATGKPPQITTASAKAMEALAVAETALNERRKALSDSLVPLHKTLHQSWQVPPAVAESLGTARTVADGILSLAESRNIKAAQTRLNEQIPRACVSLANAASKWRGDAAKYLAALADHPPALPEQGDVRLAEAVVAWKKQFGDNHDYVVVERADLEKELAATHAAFQQARTIFGDLRTNGQEVAEWARDLFVPPANAAHFNEIVSIAKSHADSLAADLDNPDSNRAVPAQRQRDEKAAWEKALLSSIPNADPAQVKAKLEQGQWTAAAQIAREQMVALSRSTARERDSVEETALGPEASAEIPTPIGTSAPVARGIPFLTLPVIGTSSTADSLRPVPELTGSVAERIVLARAEGFAAFVQTAILSVIFIALAYGVYGGQWIGTFREMLGIFAWAFGLDLTADSLAPLLKKVGNPPTAT